MSTATLEPQLAQRWSALERANEVRSRRRTLKRDLISGSVSVYDLISEPEWWLLKVPVYELLSWAPRLGMATISRELKREKVWPLKPVGELTARQRDALVRRLLGLPEPQLELEPEPVVEAPPVVAAVVDRSVPPARTMSGSYPNFRCGRCGEHMRHAAETCGFCASEKAA